MEFVARTRMALSPGAFNYSESIALGEAVQLCGGVTVDDREQFVPAEEDRATLIRYTGDPNLADSFVFVLGPYLDAPPLKCGNCGRDLTRYVLEGQVVRITFECPECEYHTSV